MFLTKFHHARLYKNKKKKTTKLFENILLIFWIWNILVKNLQNQNYE